jgi:hypothetical protein
MMVGAGLMFAGAVVNAVGIRNRKRESPAEGQAEPDADTVGAR